MKQMIFSLLIVLSSLSYLQALTDPTKHLIDRINENASYCVQEITNDKIFIHPENVLLVEEGLVLDLNGFEFVPLPLLQSNSIGCYLQFGEEIIHEHTHRQITQLARVNHMSIIVRQGPCPNCKVLTDKKRYMS